MSTKITTVKTKFTAKSYIIRYRLHMISKNMKKKNLMTALYFKLKIKNLQKR